ncbi:hypothetical protein SETIT_8G086300v2 [Setaria italica]|uniref:non-specific serine/threonine protein kinase n=1 Tax=Setaria italica TaxID=4555 RepID=A0A368S5S9_SETIT|nr:uncharacterized protein LOC101761718 [Setaria italica]RCV37731.1 hypothetical protein SETIT_8G086300v2 [Setaria italica]
MAEVMASPMGSVIDKPTELLLANGIRFLKDELNSMYVVLQKLAEKEDDQIDPLVLEWRNEVRELSYHIKDCIDRFMLNHSNGDSKANFVRKLVRKVKMVSQYQRIAMEIEELKFLVIEQSDRAKRYAIHQYLAASPHPVVLDPRTPALIAEATDLVGIDGPREEIEMVQQLEPVQEKQHNVQGSVIGKLSAMLAEEYQLPRHVKGDIRFLKDELSCMHVVLQELEDKEDDQIDRQAIDWRNKVRELSYNIEDRIDRFMLSHSHGGSNAIFVHKIVRKVMMFPQLQRTAQEIRNLKNLVSEQSERATRYGIYQSLAASRQPVLNDRQSMGEFIGADMGTLLPKPSNGVQQGTLTVSGMEGSEIMELNILERIVDGSEEPSHLDLLLLQSITDNFSEKQRIGVGGCGEVYKGILRNGVVAVKRLFKIRTIKDKMFHREVKSLIAVRHPNIVRFLGYCSFTEERVMLLQGGTIMVDIRERLLCFDYISNGSLESHLTDELRGHEWNTRYEIIVGICKGLLYLHKEKDIIHMDLKPANILLDDHLVPKITDFGLSRLDNNSQTATTSRLMTPVYCAPEYHSEGKSSSKSDIYSLGVIITEVVTGSNKKMPDITKVLRRWRHRWIKSSNHTPLSYQQVTKCLELAQKCTQHDPTGRPDISDIIDELNQIRDSTEDQFQVIPGLEDMLGIEPLETHFVFEEPDQQISHAIELTNDTEDYFAFFTKTSLHRLRTEPEKGIVPPRSKCSVTVTMMQPLNALPTNRYKEKITVLSTRVDGGLAAMDMKGDMFIDQEGKVVDEVNVIVVLGKPSLADES